MQTDYRNWPVFNTTFEDLQALGISPWYSLLVQLHSCQRQHPEDMDRVMNTLNEFRVWLKSGKHHLYPDMTYAVFKGWDRSKLGYRSTLGS